MSAKRKKIEYGSRHPLLVYKRAMGRLWKLTFMLGAVLAFAWGWSLWESKTISILSLDTLLLAGAALAFFLTLLFFIARTRAYVQPTSKYLKLVTPFLSVNISYKRMRSARSVLVQQLFPRDEVKRSV